MKELVIIAIPIICALIAYAGVRQGRENKRLRTKLIVALQDCYAFHNLEEIYCQAIGEFIQRSSLTVKRVYRARLRAQGIDTPSDGASPQRLKSELLRLGQ